MLEAIIVGGLAGGTMTAMTFAVVWVIDKIDWRN